MIWQDIVLTIIGIIFSISLVPQVYHGFKTKAGPIRYATSVPTFLGLYIIAAVYLTLQLRLSAVIAFVTATLWLSLFIQRLVYSSKPKSETNKE